MTMHQWVSVVAIDKIPEGLSRWVKNRRRIVIIREKEKIKAVFEDKCPHNKRIKISKFFSLDLEQITCTVHGACYRLDNGIQVDGPGVDPLVIFPHRVINNRLELVID